jgi:hypothetical protein
MSPTPDGNPTREELWAAMRRDSQGMRDLQQFLDGIKDADDVAFAEATGGADRTDAMELFDRLNRLLAELGKLTAQLHPDVN